MKREDRINEMAKLRAEAEELCKQYNELIIAGKFDSSVEEKISEKVNEYTSHARTIAFEDCVATGDPMLEACKRLTYDTIRAKDEPIEDSKLKKKVIEDIGKPIQLGKLHKFADGGIGQDKNWIYALEQLNYILTAQKAVDLGIDPKDIKDNYYMSKISRDYDLGKNPASNTNLLKTLNSIIAMMVGADYKAVSHDVNYLKSIYTKKGRKALSVTCANHRFMQNYVQEICHRIICGKVYDVDYKKITKK